MYRWPVVVVVCVCVVVVVVVGGGGWWGWGGGHGRTLAGQNPQVTAAEGMFLGCFGIPNGYI